MKGPSRVVGAARRALVGAVLAGVLAALAACASLPQSGPVQQGNPDVAEPGSIALLARLPGLDDTPEQIVDGFLRASAAGLTDDFAIAREFLDGPVQASWNPLAQVRVYTGQPDTDGSGGASGSIAITAALAGTVDDGGRYVEAVPGSEVEISLWLAQDVDGQWRIVALEDGILLSEPIFRSLFQQTPIYFVSPDAEALVAETRWYPRRTVTTAAVTGLLEGPSPWLAEGVGTAFPVGTHLAVGTVTVRERTALVDLSAEALEAGPDDRAMMQVQLEQTLIGLSGVRAVAVRVTGMPLDVPGVAPDVILDPPLGTSPVVLAGGMLQRVEGGALVPLADAAPIAAPDPSSPAIPYGGDVAVLLSGGASLVTVPPDAAATAVLLAGSGALTAPSFDREGWVWTAPVAGGAGVVHAVRTDATRVDVVADWLLRRQVRALRVSRDGARVLTVSTVDGSLLIEVAAVIRGADGTPLALGDPLRIGQRVSEANVAVWVDQQTAAVLGRVGSGTVDTAVLVPIGGPTNALPAVDGAIGLASGKGDRLLFVSTATGELFARNGLGWTSVIGGVRDPAFPG